MNQKQIGVILIILGLIIGGFVYATKLREDKSIDAMISVQNGSCYLADGTCLHDDRSYTIYVIGYAIAAALLLFGLYLTFVDRTEEVLQRHQKDVSSALLAAKMVEKEKDEFGAFLSGFTEEEQRVLRAIREQDGIQQSTLRFKTGMSKTGLSLLLKSLEDREIISRKEDGKTNKVYLRKR
jgi:DNA-binding MarR family transcriptional regulator